MTGPIITDTSVVDLKTLQEASLRDRATVERWVEVTAENEEVYGAWVVVDEQVPVQYVPLSARTATIAAATGVVATGLLKERITGDIHSGDRVLIRGHRSGTRFQRLMNVGLPFQAPGRTIRRLAVTDADLSRG